MFVSLRMITLPPGRTDEAEAMARALRIAASGLPGAGPSHVQTAYAGLSFNAGHVIWRMEFASEMAAAAAPQSAWWHEQVAPLLAGTHIDGAGYAATRKGRATGRGGIWRALVFRVMPSGFPNEARALESALLMMPSYVSTIRGWGLSTVSTWEGDKPFTHVWEQEFDGPEGFTGEYMNHPIHWGLVDSWFDAECPQYIVDPGLSQPVMAIDAPIIA